MKSIVLTNVAGDKVRVSPLALIGWQETKVPVPAPSGGVPLVYMGATIAMAGAGAVQVRESVEQIDFLFERATDGVTPPPRDDD